MSGPAPSPHALRVADLPQNARSDFEIIPDAAAMQALATELDLDGLRKLRFTGHIAALGDSDWQLKGQLGATVTQPCSVTLAPVTTRIDVPVMRLFLRDYTDPDTPEAEMPEDDTVEALQTWIDPHAIMVEALSLALPEYPRADDAALGETVHSAPGVVALRDADLKPFAGLAALKAQLGNDESDEEG